MPQVNDYIVDPILTNVSLKYTSMDLLIADKLFPRLEVPAKQGYYYVFDKANMRIEDSRRSGVSRANRVNYSMSKTAYGPLVEHSLEEAIEYDVRDTYPTPMDARTDATEDVTEKMYLSHEKDVADILTSTSYITNNTTLSGTDQWSDYANSDPFGDIQTGIDTIHAAAIIFPNKLELGYQVWSKLKHHPDLLARLSTAAVRVLTEDLLASLLGVDEIVIGRAMYNSAAEGQTDSLSYIWGKHAVLMYVTPTPGIKKVTTGYTLQVKNARYVDRWDEPQVKAEFVRANDYYEPKVIAAGAAYLLKNVVA